MVASAPMHAFLEFLLPLLCTVMYPSHLLLSHITIGAIREGETLLQIRTFTDDLLEDADRLQPTTRILKVDIQLEICLADVTIYRSCVSPKIASPLWSFFRQTGRAKDGTCDLLFSNPVHFRLSYPGFGCGSWICFFVSVQHSLTLSQATNFRLFQTETVCRHQFQI